jgi:uncharacterized protein (DUF2252 family)
LSFSERQAGARVPELVPIRYGRASILIAARDTLGFDRRKLLEQFELSDFARKVVGVGSVGTRAWIALLLGRDGQDPLFLQMKEAAASVLEGFLGKSEFPNHGERVVAKGDSFDRAMVEFSKAYADQNQRDYEALEAAVKSDRIEAAVKSGRIKAETGL